jgi:hypothetical protein
LGATTTYVQTSLHGSTLVDKTTPRTTVRHGLMQWQWMFGFNEFIGIRVFECFIKVITVKGMLNIFSYHPVEATDAIWTAQQVLTNYNSYRHRHMFMLSNGLYFTLIEIAAANKVSYRKHDDTSPKQIQLAKGLFRLVLVVSLCFQFSSKSARFKISRKTY